MPEPAVRAPRRPVVTTAAGLTLASALLAGCGPQAAGSPGSATTGDPVSTTTPSTSSPSSSAASSSSAAPSSSAAAATTPARLYWVSSSGGEVGGGGAGRPRLYQDDRDVPDLGDPVLSAVTALVVGSPTDPDQHSAWAAAPVSVSRAAGAVVVDLGGAAVAGPAPSPEEAAMAVQQLVWVAATAEGTGGPVAITVDGAPARLWEAVEVGAPTELGPQAEVLSAVQILSPAHGEGVPAGPVAVRGTSSTPEGTVTWEVTDAGGAVIAEGYATGGSYDGFADLAFTADAPAAGLASGDYTLSAWAPDESGGEGGLSPRANGDTKSFTVG